MLATAPAPPCIGVFDSGVGGLSVLRALHRRLPQASLTYFGDGAYAPYGSRRADAVLQRAERIVEHLLAQGARLIVVACNTATVTAIDRLRARWPALPFVGVEPGIKPAVLASASRRIAVMATPATVASDRVQWLIEQHAAGAHVHLQACGELAAAIEQGVLDGDALRAVLQPYCDGVRRAEVDTVVLGCTHYAFVEAQIRALLGDAVTLIDTAAAVAERAAALWVPCAAVTARPGLRLQNTGDATTMRRLAARCPGFEQVEVEAVTL